MIAIVDYGVGNLRSVQKAFEFIGVKAQVSSDKKFIEEADGVVLPGVGAYSDAMKSLEQYGLTGSIKKCIAQEKPFLGICLGMQLLFDYSEEGAEKPKGLGVFPGEIKGIQQDRGLKVPHMGWNKLKIVKDNPLFYGIPENPYVYFVHSYYLEAGDKNIVTATTPYGSDIEVAVGKGKIFATQFHPEKSGEVGLKMLRNFSQVVDAI